MKPRNIKKQLKDNEIKQWQLADELQIQESALSKILRYKLTGEQETQIILAIEAIKLSRKER